MRLVNRVKEAWADIDVQLKRRYDLIPNLVETVKGYATHEREAFEKVTEARARALGAQTVKEKGEADNQVKDTEINFCDCRGLPATAGGGKFLPICKTSWLIRKIKFKRLADSITAMSAT